MAKETISLPDDLKEEVTAAAEAAGMKKSRWWQEAARLLIEQQVNGKQLAVDGYSVGTEPDAEEVPVTHEGIVSPGVERFIETDVKPQVEKEAAVETIKRVLDAEEVDAPTLRDQLVKEEKNSPHVISGHEFGGPFTETHEHTIVFNKTGVWCEGCGERLHKHTRASTGNGGVWRCYCGARSLDLGKSWSDPEEECWL